jgi:hypothetical protein
MKRFTILLLSFVGIMMSGCLVTSLHPFYKTNDKIFDRDLIGNWIDSDSSIWIIEPNKKSKEFMGPEFLDSTYLITYYEDEDAASYLKGTLFVLNGKKYVDFFPDDEGHFTTDMSEMHHIPVHTLARIASSKDSIMFFWFGEDWLNALFDGNRVRVEHETIDHGDYESRVLTADTDDLQKFVKKYMETESIQQQFDFAYANNVEADEHVFLKLYPYEGPVKHSK